MQQQQQAANLERMQQLQQVNKNPAKFQADNLPTHIL